MNYAKHYNLLIERALYRSNSGYVESHHIIPKCMGGIDIAENRVNLRADEHYLAHLLLVKMYPDVAKLVYAANMMTVAGRSKVRNNKRYKWLREKMAKTMSEDFKGQRRSIATEWKPGHRPANVGIKSKTSPGNRGKYYITDGVKNIVHEPKSPIPSGWKRGMTKSKYTNNGKSGTFERSESTKKRMSQSAKLRVLNSRRDPMTGAFLRAN